MVRASTDIWDRKKIMSKALEVEMIEPHSSRLLRCVIERA
jgi:hypothetical protein